MIIFSRRSQQDGFTRGSVNVCLELGMRVSFPRTWQYIPSLDRSVEAECFSAAL